LQDFKLFLKNIEEMMKIIVYLILFVLLVICLYNLTISLSKLQRVRDFEKLSKYNSSRLLRKTGIVFDKSTNKIVSDQDIIV
jgi:ABC-type polysaccharide/polyol phosphate export permease